MTKPLIVTRVGKGSALTYAEQDANFTNLQNATITVTDGTNSRAIDLNGSITFVAGNDMDIQVDTDTGEVSISSQGGAGNNQFGSINPTVYNFSTNMGTTTVTSLPYENNFVNQTTSSGNNYYFNFDFIPTEPTHWRFFVDKSNATTAFVPQYDGSNMILLNTGTNANAAGNHIYDVYYTGADSVPTWGGGFGGSWVYWITT